MKRFLQGPLPDTPDHLMEKAGYVRHCVEAGRACFHRKIDHPPFPRFHAYVRVRDGGMEIDLHWDQINMTHKGNHDKEWAYHGGRVEGEMTRIVDEIHGHTHMGKINAPYHPPHEQPKPTPPKKRSFFDILFR